MLKIFSAKHGFKGKLHTFSDYWRLSQKENVWIRKWLVPRCDDDADYSRYVNGGDSDNHYDYDDCDDY